MMSTEEVVYIKDIWLSVSDYLEPHDVIALGLINQAMCTILHDKLHEHLWNYILTPLVIQKSKCPPEGKVNVITCSIYPNKLHNLRVRYTHNPRDVDILTWYLDEQEVGWTML